VLSETEKTNMSLVDSVFKENAFFFLKSFKKFWDKQYYDIFETILVKTRTLPIGQMMVHQMYITDWTETSVKFSEKWDGKYGMWFTPLFDETDNTFNKLKAPKFNLRDAHRCVLVTKCICGVIDIDAFSNRGSGFKDFSMKMLQLCADGDENIGAFNKDPKAFSQKECMDFMLSVTEDANNIFGRDKQLPNALTKCFRGYILKRDPILERQIVLLPSARSSCASWSLQRKMKKETSDLYSKILSDACYRYMFNLMLINHMSSKTIHEIMIRATHIFGNDAIARSLSQNFNIQVHDVLAHAIEAFATAFIEGTSALQLFLIILLLKNIRRVPDNWNGMESEKVIIVRGFNYDAELLYLFNEFSLPAFRDELYLTSMLSGTIETQTILRKSASLGACDLGDLIKQPEIPFPLFIPMTHYRVFFSDVDRMLYFAVNWWCKCNQNNSNTKKLENDDPRHISNWDVSRVKDMNGLFSDRDSFNDSLALWDVSNVTNMSSMFRNATKFNQDLSAWNVSKVTSMDEMFFSAHSFNNADVLLDWKKATKRFKAKDMKDIFRNTKIDLESENYKWVKIKSQEMSV
jgi:surface protein